MGECGQRTGRCSATTTRRRPCAQPATAKDLPGWNPHRCILHQDQPCDHVQPAPPLPTPVPPVAAFTDPRGTVRFFAPPADSCPRCGAPRGDQPFYGPCSTCVTLLRQLRPPKPDRKNYRRTTTLSGHEIVEYVGPVMGVRR